MASPVDPPSDEVLLELGRLMWAAIYLEDVTYAVCSIVKPPGDNGPIGTVIERTSTVAAEVDKDLGQRTVSWLDGAARGLAIRNSIVHATPSQFVPLPGTTPVPGVPMDYLTHVPRSRDKDVVHTPVTLETLTTLRSEIGRVTEGWTEIAIAWRAQRREE